MPFAEISELRDCLVKQLSPERIYLFGSYADGTFNEDSDFDFYIVMEDDGGDPIALMTRAYKAVRGLEYAENDLAVAKHLMATFYPKPLEIVCYYCQQAAEKAVKAVYVALDIPGGVPKKHDLSFLLAQMRRCVPVAEDMRPRLPYAMPTKYWHGRKRR